MIMTGQFWQAKTRYRNIRQIKMFITLICSGLLACAICIPSFLFVENAFAKQVYAAATLKAPTINKKNVSLNYGATVNLKVNNANGKKVTWKSSNPKIAKITKKGKNNAIVKAFNAGRATITGAVNGKKVTCKVKVSAKLNKSSVSLMSFQNAKLALNGAKAKSWRSTEASIVSVNSSGKLITHGYAGNVTITCTDTKGVKYKCKVKVSMPRFSCGMNTTYEYGDAEYGDTPYYCKQFHFYNRSNYAVRLENSFMIYYPDKSTIDPSIKLIGVHDDYDLDRITPSDPIIIQPGNSSFFYGYEGESYYPVTDIGTFGLFVKVGTTECMCLFTTSGELGVCVAYDY